MAAVNVTIIFNGPAVIADREGESIFRYFAPNNSYVDTPVFTEGYANEAQVGDKGTYGKSIYATNVEGFGDLLGLIPMASTNVIFAQYQRAIFAAKDAEEAGEENEGITFSIGEDYKDEIYWNQIAPNMVDQGFYTKVGDKEYGTKN